METNAPALANETVNAPAVASPEKVTRKGRKGGKGGKNVPAGVSTPEALKARLSGVDSLKGRELMETLGKIIEEIALSFPRKVGKDWILPNGMAQVFSSDKDKRKEQMESFKASKKARKIVTRNFYAYIESRGLGTAQVDYAARVAKNGTVSASEKTVIKVSESRPSFAI